MDGSPELIDGGFGLYSTVDLKVPIGPIKTEYFRIVLIRAGRVTVRIGLETFHLERDSMVFGFPGQIFALSDKSDNFFGYYLLFREGFLPESRLWQTDRERHPFLTHAGIQSFRLDEGEAAEVENFVFSINREIRNRRPGTARAIQLYIELILLQAGRSYERQQLRRAERERSGNALCRRFVKLVGRHFLTLRKVADYAKLLHVSPDHLNRTIRSQSDKTARELIDEMILLEAKAYLKNTELSNAEIAYQLAFADPSHFNKFFKKQMNCTPHQYRAGS
jgi:AraC-like DNA-binding protein